MARVQIIGIEALVKGLDERANLDDVKKVVSKNGERLEEEMKRLTAKDSGVFKKHYATGATQGSIHLTKKDDGLTVEVEPQTEYASYPEYGTRFMAAEPYVKPSFNKAAKTFKSDMKKLVR